RGAVLSGSGTVGGVKAGAPAGAPARRRRRAGGGFCVSDVSFSGSWVLSAMRPSPSGGPAHPGPVWSSSLRTEVSSPHRRAAPPWKRCDAERGSTAVAVVRVAGAPTSRRREVPPPGTERQSASASMAQGAFSAAEDMRSGRAPAGPGHQDHGPGPPSGRGVAFMTACRPLTGVLPHMDALDLARWQFGITTVYHFIFVPLTIGLSLLVAIMHTRAVYAKDALRKDAWTRMTKFFGSMLIVNFGIGIATGIVQEFQFGMNWSEYARYVGDVFGAPLALEGLAAFFLESVFLGLWIFGWGKMPEKIHLLTIWAVALGTTLSAYFIIAANSFMQHPVGAMLNPETGRAELDPSQGSILSVLT